MVFTCNMLTELHDNIICQAMYGILLTAKVHVKLVQICWFWVTSHPHFDTTLDWFCRQVLDIGELPLEANHCFINCLVLARIVMCFEALLYHFENWPYLVQLVMILACGLSSPVWHMEILHEFFIPFQCHCALHTSIGDELIFMPVQVILQKCAYTHEDIYAKKSPHFWHRGITPSRVSIIRIIVFSPDLIPFEHSIIVCMVDNFAKHFCFEKQFKIVHWCSSCCVKARR